jgi:hypothetical protein
MRADAVDGPSTPASSLFQNKAENTTLTIQAVDDAMKLGKLLTDC